MTQESMQYTVGLTAEEVKNRIEKGQINRVPGKKTGKTVKEIILTNTITFFNLLNLIFFLLILFVGSYKNGTFAFLLIINTGIGIIQEIRTKKTLDSLRLMTAPKARAIRDHSLKTIPVEDLVMDDVILLRSGDSVPSDCILLSGEPEVNESLLTGEEDNVPKKTGSQLYSGSFIVSGEGMARVIHVGSANYIETISEEARKFQPVNSLLRNYINKILKTISYIIVPLCGLFFALQYFVRHTTLQSAVVQTVSAGIGMIPEGLVLLTSIALTLGVLRLSRKKTLVQELYCIETLARVDTICFDKTGTLTKGKMKVENAYPLADSETMDAAFSQVLYAADTLNPTTEALRDYYEEPSKKWNVKKVIPFSSDRKYSGFSFEDKGTYYMGASSILFPANTELNEAVSKQAELGFRVIVIGHSIMDPVAYEIPGDLKPIGYVTLSDLLRDDCEKTLTFFKNQGVDLKCISGDDPLTVSRIAKKCGFESADSYVDATTLKNHDDIQNAVRTYSVFGRVTPQQKREMVECLQADGHVVAMTGDGVNDILAMKKSDCSIAMATGSEATKHAAQIVLLNSDFQSMPDIVKEGRRVINNIRKASSMYLIKTTYSVLLTFFLLILGFIFPEKNTEYPFMAIQQTLISAFAVGIPTFFMQLEPSFKKPEKNFMLSAFRSAIPAGITIAIFSLLIKLIFGIFNTESTVAQLSTLSVLSMGYIYFFSLKRIYSPMNLYRRIVAYTMEVLYILIMIFAEHILEFQDLRFSEVMVLLAAVTATPIFIDIGESIFDYVEKKKEKIKERKTLKRKAK